MVRLLSPFDLHVLGLPPAFILSQDQTLIKSFALKEQGSRVSTRAFLKTLVAVELVGIPVLK